MLVAPWWCRRCKRSKSKESEAVRCEQVFPNSNNSIYLKDDRHIDRIQG
jgi:hypothetical protein